MFNVLLLVIGRITMSRAVIVLEVEDPHFTIRLYADLLKIDLKGSFKNELEEALENKPVPKETIGRVLGIFVPLHIHISDIDWVHMDETGKIKLSLSYHRNIVFPFERKEDAEKLTEKLDQLISKAKLKTREYAKRRTERRLKKKTKNKILQAPITPFPYYFPTEQVDIVDKRDEKGRKQKK